MKTIETTLTVTDKGTAVVTKFTDTAKKQFGEVESSVKKTDKAFDGLGKTIAKLTAGYLSLRAAMDFSKMVVGHLDIVDNINKMSERLGISTKLFQEMRYAMSLSGVTLQEFEVGMRRFVTGLYDATKNTGLLIDSMLKYGITAGSTEDVLDQVANLIQRTANEQERLNIATTFFGDRVGMSFISLMKDGAAGLAKFKKEAADLGLILDKDAAEGATEAKDALEKMGAVVENIKNKLVVALAPALKDVADKTLEWYKANKQLVDEKVKTFVESLSTIITTLANNIDIVVEAVRVLANLLGAVIIGYVVGLTVKIGLWTAALVYNAVMHIKATAALYQFGLAALNGGRIMGLVTIAARGMWAAIGGPVGIAAGIAFILLQFIGIEKIVNALKTAFDYILTTVKSIGTAISNWFAGGSTLDEQISAAEKRVENERKNLESMKKMGGGKDDLRVAAARLAKEEAILATLKAQKTTSVTPSESKFVGTVPTSTGAPAGGHISSLTKEDLDLIAKYQKEAQDSLQHLTALEEQLLTIDATLTRMYQSHEAHPGGISDEDLAQIEKYAKEAQDSLQQLTPMEEELLVIEGKLTRMAQERANTMNEGYLKTIESIKELGKSIEDNIIDNLTDAVMAAKSWKDALVDALKSIASEMFKLGLRMVWLNAIGEQGTNGGWLTQLLGLFGSGAGATAGSAAGGTTAMYMTTGVANGGVLAGGFQAFGTGGIAKKPTLGLIGEGKYNEAVVPLPDGRSIPVTMKGGGGINTTINVNVNGGQGGGADPAQGKMLGQQVARIVEEEFNKNIIKQQRPGGLLYAQGA